MELTVLGSGGGWALANGAACGYLLQHDGFNLWVDAGTGTLANLQAHVAIPDVDAVVISHRHFDHFLDLYPYFLARYYPVPDRLPKQDLFAPPGMFEHALQLEPELAGAFDAHVVELGSGFEVGPFSIRTAPMRHPVPTLGMRIEADGTALAYSADTGPTDELVRLATGADLMLCEATWLAVPPAAGPFHLTPPDAGDLAARAGVGRLVLTHIWPTNDREETRGMAEAAFGGPVDVAEVGMRVHL